MDDIRDIIQIMGQRDRNNFTRFLNVGLEKDSRVDLLLFEELSSAKPGTSKKKNKDIASRNRVNQNRRRLMEKLTEYFVIKSLKEDVTGASSVMGLMVMSRYLFEAKMNRLGWKIIKKAEKLGWEKDQYNLLNAIYLMMIEHADSFHATDIKTLIRKKTEAWKLAQQEENILIATQVVKQKLHEVKTSGKSLNFNAYLETVMNKFKISDAVFQDPKHLFSIIQLVRNTYLANRDMTQFLSFVLTQYNTLENVFGFKKQHHAIKIEIEYMIAHAFYLKRKYQDSLEYLRKMYHSMGEYGKIHYTAYHPRYISLLSSIKAFTGNAREAVNILKSFLKTTRHMTVKDEMNIHLNLAVFHHFNKEYEKAHEVFLKQKHSDEWLENKMGREFVLRKNLVYALNLYDMHEEELSIKTLNIIIENNIDLLELPQYLKVKVYCDMLIDYIKDPVLSQKQFMETMAATSEKYSIRIEENKTIAFFCWLLAKVKNVDYYTLTLDMVKHY